MYEILNEDKLEIIEKKSKFITRIKKIDKKINIIGGNINRI